MIINTEGERGGRKGQCNNWSNWSLERQRANSALKGEKKEAVCDARTSSWELLPHGFYFPCEVEVRSRFMRERIKGKLEIWRKFEIFPREVEGELI